MTNANTNSTSEVSEITDGTSISSSQYTTKPDNKAGSTDVLTQTDNAQVSNDSNRSHDFLSTSISVSSQSIQSATSTVELTLSDSLDKAKSTLKMKELKHFQTSCITAIQQGEDVVLVQPTGSGKSVCFVIPALLNPGKVCLVV